jgi:hypothetical protein
MAVLLMAKSGWYSTAEPNLFFWVYSETKEKQTLLRQPSVAQKTVPALYLVWFKQYYSAPEIRPVNKSGDILRANSPNL